MRNTLFLLLLPALLAACTLRDRKPEAAAFEAPRQNAYRLPLQQIREAEAQLQDGDLVVRDGQEFTSQLIKRLNRTDPSYSHAGMVFIEDGKPVVYHILSGEENPDQKILRDSLAHFANPRKNFGFALYRYDLNTAEKDRLHQQFRNWYGQGLRFDTVFNLKTDDRMYCSEMIRKGLARATNNRIVTGTTRTTRQEAEFCSGRYFQVSAEEIMKLDLVAIDHLYTVPGCRRIQRYEFKYDQPQ